MSPQEAQKLQDYLREKFGTQTLVVRPRKEQAEDSAEVTIGNEFIGVIFKDEDEGEVSYAFQMAILDIDLTGGSIESR